MYWWEAHKAGSRHRFCRPLDEITKLDIGISRRSFNAHFFFKFKKQFIRFLII